MIVSANRCCICGCPENNAIGYAMPHLTQGLVKIPTRFGPTPNAKLICAACVTDGVQAWSLEAFLVQRAAEEANKKPPPQPPKQA